jgi:uncharacterized protein (DUF305 family)
MIGMTLPSARGLTAALLAAITTACAGATQSAAQSGAPPTSTPTTAAPRALTGAEKARADSLRYPYVAGDVHFMNAMIGHHAQAIVMSGWAASHGANPAVVRLADRIINAQQDEINTMQSWLRDRRLPVPEAKPGPMKMMMDGMEHEMLMPGMLTDEQMKQLDQARGKEFDRLFLTDMIQHHRGAVSMVKDLFGTYGAAQDETVFKFASDVQVDQSTEIARMERMLAALTLGITVP